MGQQAAPVVGKYRPIEVSRTGSFVEMSGSRQNIGENTLHQIARGYNR